MILSRGNPAKSGFINLSRLYLVRLADTFSLLFATLLLWSILATALRGWLPPKFAGEVLTWLFRPSRAV